MNVRDLHFRTRRGIVTFLRHSELRHLLINIAVPDGGFLFDKRKYHENLESFTKECSAVLPNLRELDIQLPGVLSLQGQMRWLEFEPCHLPKLRTLRLFFAQCPEDMQSSTLSQRLQALSYRRALREVVLCFANIAPETPQKLEIVSAQIGGKLEALPLAGFKITLVLDSVWN
ncbi:hypothetical protein CYLTODRAFT_423058 [Cylindrobasidium torrendii FP15055 ss-10]|uniref:Uncharacterized protein n=1 Tax=Cylindrobasidium torrendii FP15055 ss-10 TaxID=1314674 RepID=A0A0D7B8Q5_9AGAR|nr:hypothetical protein CYLTODRAFT_423058 [Cylindrobasidium torrendii FP15055 ss-10]